MAMINIDDRILAKVDSNELWLLVHLVKRLNKYKTCFPSNDTLCQETGWNIDKLQKIKGQLIKKKMLKVQLRKTKKGRGSNLYTIKSPHLSVFVNVGEFEIEDLPENTVEPIPENTVEPGGAKSGREVLTNNEVLIIEDIADKSAQKSTVYQDSIELYDQFCKRTIGTGAKINGAEGKAMKEIITYLRTNSQDKTDAGVLKALTFIFSNWDILEPYLRSRKKLIQINSDLVNIINCLRNGNAKQQGTTAESLRKLNDLVRRQEAGNA